ncbi:MULTISPECIES: hypothetical protein [unclassified Streptomyces]|uniref:hypothetical protein n=1 Tax=unclassified Streptomyces TaxID=2593676 RepID=UPI000967B498|nr:hypothetical protein [Streptomyces sp. CB02058]OKI85890.1 hypothetical protein AMK10_35410 [Streptomyces sp. CB02058]
MQIIDHSELALFNSRPFIDEVVEVPSVAVWFESNAVLMAVRGGEDVSDGVQQFGRAGVGLGAQAVTQVVVLTAR